ncbi:FAD-dependent oxidoreductase [Micromonospora saelicesensis]|uniref:2,4-dichlorophenol 6-monooxygenase n=1 Tax=Micromonospora saelicesensis TaxID=285676 RepID=A0ABX9CA45_9ACTN|nr:FAD-dependent oxidoreductase [Micromonospora saelicesensis]RAN92143.1 2,4-dichlorophenol 6-monooxygenase [Micromonospora saelicesensis]RAO41672.1 2,4-dichlorophenol 6-monooxygenase [Micromonospora saelicesensis]
MSDGSTDVLIVGGGPVGLSTALFLARKGIRPILVERRPRLSTIPRATGLHARTVEIFRTVGLEPAVQQAGMKIVGPGAELDLVRAGRATPLVMLGAQSLADLHKSFVMEAHDVDYDKFTPSWPIWCGQDHYEPLLHDAAVEAGAEIRFQNELIGLTQDEDGVTATVNDNGTTRTIRARYVVAADGVKSPVRDLLQIGNRSNGVAGNFVSIIFRAKVDLPESAPRFTLIYLMNQLAQGLLLFIEPGRWMFGVNYYPERGQSPADFTPERCVELARIAAGDPELDVEVESAQPWDARHMVADAYQSGRVFLAGDACHAHPPAGGFGVNAGIQDAHNLAWKLADVLHGHADESLLDSYEAERRPVGAATADQAWMLFRTRGQLADEDKAAYRDFVIVTMGYRYTSNAIVGAPADTELLPRELTFTGQPGSRAPHGWVDQDGARVSTIDVLTEGWTLATAPGDDAWLAAAEAVSAETGLPIKALTAGPGGDLADDGSWLASCGVGPGGALLVRPDGIVAFRSAGPVDDKAQTLTAALATILRGA